MPVTLSEPDPDRTDLTDLDIAILAFRAMRQRHRDRYARYDTPNDDIDHVEAAAQGHRQRTPQQATS